MEIKDDIKKALNQNRFTLNWKELGFLDQIKDANKLTEKQASWCLRILNKTGLSKANLLSSQIEDFKIVKSKDKNDINNKPSIRTMCNHEDLRNNNHKQGTTITCPFCGAKI